MALNIKTLMPLDHPEVSQASYPIQVQTHKESRENYSKGRTAENYPSHPKFGYLKSIKKGKEKKKATPVEKLNIIK